MCVTISIMTISISQLMTIFYEGFFSTLMSMNTILVLLNILSIVYNMLLETKNLVYLGASCVVCWTED